MYQHEHESKVFHRHFRLRSFLSPLVLRHRRPGHPVHRQVLRQWLPINPLVRSTVSVMV